MNQAGVPPIPVTRRSWSALSDRSKTAVLVLASIQLSLAVTAWIDLARRPASLVRGSKVAWAAVIAVTLAGPAAYFTLGRLPRSAGPGVNRSQVQAL
jgi:hypothetical protein